MHFDLRGGPIKHRATAARQRSELFDEAEGDFSDELELDMPIDEISVVQIASCARDSRVRPALRLRSRED